MSEHHGQHARCRACGTNPRAREETQAFEGGVDTLCDKCGAVRSWVWSRKVERSVLRSCPCGAPKGDKVAARERIAQIRRELKERTT